MVTDMEHVIGGVFKKVADTDEWPVKSTLFMGLSYNHP